MALVAQCSYFSNRGLGSPKSLVGQNQPVTIGCFRVVYLAFTRISAER